MPKCLRSFLQPPHDHHNTLQTITVISICLERPSAADHKKKRVAPQWKMLTLFVWLPDGWPVGVGVLIIKYPSGLLWFVPRGSQHSGGLLLPGQASPDSSHGSEPLGQAAAAISPLTLFHERPNGSQMSLRKPARTVHPCKTQYGTRAIGLYKISIVVYTVYCSSLNTCDLQWWKW